MDNQEQIKAENRKAIPKFLLLVVIAAVVGGVIGFCATKVNFATETLYYAAYFFGIKIAPWILLGMAILLPIGCVCIYQDAKKLLDTWDFEDESISDKIDAKLSAILWISSAALVVSYFLIAAVYSGGFSILDDSKNILGFFVGIAGFAAILVEAILIQQRCVDAVKKMNPEKTASIYDMKFQQKWLESCDEAEKIFIGQCAFKAYSATNTVCSILAVVLAIGALTFEIGFLPSLAVSVIWLVNMSVYFRESRKIGKPGSRTTSNVV